MANPFLPLWEYIPDGEPRVFGDRVYIYGSHDTAGSDCFCDYKLKVWSAAVDDLNNWTCHGDIFHTRPVGRTILFTLRMLLKRMASIIFTATFFGTRVVWLLPTSLKDRLSFYPGINTTCLTI